jgi:hypothetical protein
MCRHWHIEMVTNRCWSYESLIVLPSVTTNSLKVGTFQAGRRIGRQVSAGIHCKLSADLGYDPTEITLAHYIGSLESGSNTDCLAKWPDPPYSSAALAIAADFTLDRPEVFRGGTRRCPTATVSTRYQRGKQVNLHWILSEATRRIQCRAWSANEVPTAGAVCVWNRVYSRMLWLISLRRVVEKDA